MTLTFKTKTAFTLAETLITLAIIGVIATLTIPNLIQKHQTQETISKLNKAYSVFSNALKMAEIENGPIETWDIGEPIGSDKDNENLGKKLIPYFKTQKICGQEEGCFPDNYKTLQGTLYKDYINKKGYYKAILSDGMSIAIYSSLKACQTGQCGSIRVDINGLKGPNRAGIDLFVFQVFKKGIVLSRNNLNDSYYGCNYSNNTPANGLFCTTWVYFKHNMDYLKRDVSWDE